MDGEVVFGHGFEGAHEADGETGFAGAEVEVLAGDVAVVVQGGVQDFGGQREFWGNHLDVTYYTYWVGAVDSNYFRIDLIITFIIFIITFSNIITLFKFVMSLADKRKLPSK